MLTNFAYYETGTLLETHRALGEAINNERRDDASARERRDMWAWQRNAIVRELLNRERK